MTDRAERRGKEDLVAAYKLILQSYIDRRPSGTRLKIADAIGKHKSFVSQITNPAYPVPVPARHVTAIMGICHFSREERETFLAAYRVAHPNQSRRLDTGAGRRAGHHTLHVEVPLFDDPELQHEVEDAIRHFARRIIALAQRGRE
ncbi:MAG: hypothetical protein ACE5GS_07360 [Kiloniellaceae bacterium]